MIVFRQFLKGFKKGFHEFNNNTALVINFVLLTFIYFIGVGMSFILVKISRKRFLHIEQSNSFSYWNDLDLKTKPLEEYYRQF